MNDLALNCTPSLISWEASAELECVLMCFHTNHETQVAPPHRHLTAAVSKFKCACRTLCVQGCRDEDFSITAATQIYTVATQTTDHYLHYAGPKSASFRVCACVSMHAPVIPKKGTHSWSVTVATRVALLNQNQCGHVHFHGSRIKAGSVRQIGMLNQTGWED